MARSFPYPSQGGSPRPLGQGCRVCVHQTYCPALYWLRRNGPDQPEDRNGIACQSWSDNEADIVKTVTDDDRAKEQQMYIDGIQSEANRNGITDPTTGGRY